MRLTEDGVRRARARAQLLGERTASSPAEVVAATVGIQSQDTTEAGLSIRARSRGLVLADVMAALGAHDMVSTWSLRGTRHWHAAEDVRWILGLLGPVFGRPGRRAEQLGIAGSAGDRAARALRDALAADGPLSRSDVKERLADHGVDPSGQAPIHVIRRAALEGVLCVVPGADGKDTYALLDDCVPPAEAVGPDRAAAELARRYLAAFGPATAADFTRWSGLGAPVARRAWSSVADELEEVAEDDNDVALWILRRCHAQVDRGAGSAAPLRLLGGFDTLLLGYDDRRHLVPPERAGDVNAGGGIVRPTVLADGRVVGTWSRKGSTPSIRTFRTLTQEEQSEVDEELDDVDRFLGRRPPG